MKGPVTTQLLDNLFEEQMKRLDNAKCPPNVIVSFWRAKQRIIDRVMRSEIGQHDFPFVLVVPKTILSSKEQMGMIKFNKEAGVIDDIDLREIKDCLRTPPAPYCLVAPGINGRHRKHTAQQCLTFFQENGKTALTSVELMALALHSPLFKRHQGCFAGSSRFTPGKVPVIHTTSGKPTLSWEFIYANKWQWTTPYCRERITL